MVEVRAEKKLRVAINGFGRIGRTFVRCWHGRKNSLLDVVAINDSGEFWGLVVVCAAPVIPLRQS